MSQRALPKVTSQRYIPNNVTLKKRQKPSAFYVEDQVILNKGIQMWTVPVTGSYVIEAAGASGGNGLDRPFFPAHWKLGGLGANDRNFPT